MAEGPATAIYGCASADEAEPTETYQHENEHPREMRVQEASVFIHVEIGQVNAIPSRIPLQASGLPGASSWEPCARSAIRIGS